MEDKKEVPKDIFVPKEEHVLQHQQIELHSILVTPLEVVHVLEDKVEIVSLHQEEPFPNQLD